ncbi:MAG TPA: hypothetical protein VEM96_01435 [Pyrinomonadaceae bacterium]|nr:hypothetical protein [Pyrinomonadaceae bacterium]
MFNLSPQNGSRPRSAWPRLVMAVVLVLTFSIAASAYTLVFRNGQRMEIPAEFTLTRTTLTYEISPGFNKTMLLTLIDVAATERANHEAAGSFFQHTDEPPVVTQSAAPRASKTLTNRDLLAIRQRRIESEEAYERRRKELQLPTVEETRRRQDQEAAILHAELREKSLAREQEETYWRERARELRTEITTVDTQINYLRGRLGDLSESSLRTRSWVTGTYPLWPDNRQWSGNGQWGSNPNQRRGGYRPARPIIGLGFPNGYPTGQYPSGYPSGQYPYGYPTGQYPYGYPTGQYPYGYPTGQYPYGYPTGPFDNFNNSAEQGDLTMRLDDLLVRRAGLSAQWRALEDEARDARVPQVWLEP